MLNFEKFLSRKFLFGVAGIVLLVLNSFGIIALTLEQTNQIVTIIIGYLVVEGGADAIERYKD